MILGVSLCFNLFKDSDWSSGYISLKPNKPSKVFYYLIKSSQNFSDKGNFNVPLLVWIGSGPGCSASNLLFLESGPYAFDSKLHYTTNAYSWSSFSDVLYLDFPFSTGLSESERGVEAVSSVNVAANDLNMFMVNFFEMNDEYLNRKLYFACESYSCQIVTNFAANYISKGKMIQGIMLRSPMIDYRIQSNWPAYAKSIERLDFIERFINSFLLFLCRVGIQLNSEPMIRNLCDPIMERTAHKAKIECLDNINSNHCYIKEYYTISTFLNNDTVQRALGLNEHIPFNICNTTISYYMDPELKRGDTRDLTYLLNNGVNITLIFGKNNFMYNWIGGEDMAENIDWIQQKEFKEKKLEDYECGRKKMIGPLKFVVLNNAGQVITREANKCFYKEFANFMQHYI